MTTNAPATVETQSQSQSQSLTITVESSGDPLLEQRIFASVHSVGRQLGYLSAVVQVLLAAHEADSKIAPGSAAKTAIANFTRTQADIERAKRLREPERIFEQLRSATNDESRARKLHELRDWLDRFDASERAAGEHTGEAG